MENPAEESEDFRAGRDSGCVAGTDAFPGTSRVADGMLAKVTVGSAIL